MQVFPRLFFYFCIAFYYTQGISTWIGQSFSLSFFPNDRVIVFPWISLLIMFNSFIYVEFIFICLKCGCILVFLLLATYPNTIYEIIPLYSFGDSLLYLCFKSKLCMDYSTFMQVP